MIRITGNRKGQAISLNNLGLVALCQGDYAWAAKFSSESLRLSEELLDHQVIPWSLDALAGVCWSPQQSRGAHPNHSRARKGTSCLQSGSLVSMKV